MKPKAATKQQLYECRHCKARISSYTGGVVTACKCGKLAVDGTEHYVRVLGDEVNFKVVTE